jgi:hypothetical protein
MCSVYTTYFRQRAYCVTAPLGIASVLYCVIGVVKVIAYIFSTVQLQKQQQKIVTRMRSGGKEERNRINHKVYFNVMRRHALPHPLTHIIYLQGKEYVGMEKRYIRVEEKKGNEKKCPREMYNPPSSTAHILPLSSFHSRFGYFYSLTRVKRRGY